MTPNQINSASFSAFIRNRYSLANNSEEKVKSVRKVVSSNSYAKDSYNAKVAQDFDGRNYASQVDREIKTVFRPQYNSSQVLKSQESAKGNFEQIINSELANMKPIKGEYFLNDGNFITNNYKKPQSESSTKKDVGYYISIPEEHLKKIREKKSTPFSQIINQAFNVESRLTSGILVDVKV